MRPILLVAAACYRAVYKLHHSICLRPGKALEHARFIVIGSFLAGGAGKTPFTAWLAQFILENAHSATTDTGKESATKEYTAPRIAILCHSKAADEAKMLRQKFSGSPNVKVFATSNRYRTAHELDSEYDYIICDDGFEDSRLAGAYTIRLDWTNPPTGIGELMPVGKCRSLVQDHKEPALKFQCGLDIQFHIERIENIRGAALDPKTSANAVVVCGIGNPKRFRDDLADFGVPFAKFIVRPDHDVNFKQTIEELVSQKTPIIITEKDAARLPYDQLANSEIFIAYQQVNVSDAAKSKIRQAIMQA